MLTHSHMTSFTIEMFDSAFLKGSVSKETVVLHSYVIYSELNLNLFISGLKLIIRLTIVIFSPLPRAKFSLLWWRKLSLLSLPPGRFLNETKMTRSTLYFRIPIIIAVSFIIYNWTATARLIGSLLFFLVTVFCRECYECLSTVFLVKIVKKTGGE